MQCSSHQSVARISSSHFSEMFQSSCTSWSSKIIDEGTVEKSQRISGSDQLSLYSSVYSSKSRTRRPGGWSMSRRVSMNAIVAGETSSAYTWSPSSSSTSGHSSRDCFCIRSASVWRASISRPRSSSSLRSE